MKNAGAALSAGVAGSCLMNGLHETARKVVPDAPHLDLLVMKALGKTLRNLGIEPPPLATLRKAAMAADLIFNTIFFSQVGGVRKPAPPATVWKRALLLGLAAGGGTVALPPRIGLGQQTSRHFPRTAAMTVGWYAAGALAAAAVYRAFASDR